MATILCVEDECLVREYFVDELRDAEHDVIEDEDGSRRLHMAVKREPNLIAAVC